MTYAAEQALKWPSSTVNVMPLNKGKIREKNILAALLHQGYSQRACVSDRKIYKKREI